MPAQTPPAQSSPILAEPFTFSGPAVSTTYCDDTSSSVTLDAPSRSVAMLCTHTKGGPGAACVRLHQVLRASGVRSHLYAASLTTGVPGVSLAVDMPLPPEPGKEVRLSTLDRSLDMQRELMTRYPRRDDQREMFSFLTPSLHPDRNPLPPADILHLHWIARLTDPALTPAYFQKKPVVWTLHDMFPFTGGCHHADACQRYAEECGACPNLGSRQPEDHSHKAWVQRKAAYAGMHMHVVCPSRWLADKAQASSLMRGFPLHVIPHGVPLEIYHPMNRPALRQEMGMGEDDRVLLFVAHDLAQTRGTGRALLECMQRLCEMPHKDAWRVVLLGGNAPRAFFETGLRVDCPGYIDRPEMMAALYNVADMLVLPSVAENLPTVIAESLACGTPAVAYDVGGVPEMIDHERTGYLAAAGDVEALVQGVQWAAGPGTAPEVRRRCRVVALERWSLARCAAQYMQIYEGLLAEV